MTVKQRNTERTPMDYRPALLIALLLTIGIIAPSCGDSDTQAQTTTGEVKMTDKQLEGNIHAPEFPDGLDWLNTETPLKMAQLRGKIVLLDFWTFCCINCMHVIPDLKRLEAKYPDELVVIGGHSAKFTNEKQTDAIRQAVLRHEIEHPVVNDKDFLVWNSYGARAWPTLVLINPNGRVIGAHSGEGIYEPFDAIISQAIDYFDAKGQLRRDPLMLTLESNRQASTVLSFPGKIKADPAGNRLFITDTNHDRIIVTDPEGAILDVIGSGTNGNADGSFETAQFNRPQGTTLVGDTLLIADTENHTIRAADLQSRRIITVLGTGEQARRFNQRGTGTEVALNSPWDVLARDGQLYIAMAGSHQLWVAGMDSWQAEPYAGSGREARIDGLLAEAALAQPSGITADRERLYFADSETSSIRSADLDKDGKVETIIGEDLFEYGDIDGPASRARLQHPLGIVYHDGQLFVADTYNSKIKIIDPLTRAGTTFAGTGVAGLIDGNLDQAQFHEPSGITIMGNRLYVADANNHVIRVIHLAEQRVSTLQLSNLERLMPTEPADFFGRVINLPRQTIGEGNAQIRVNAALPDGYVLIEGAPLTLTYQTSDADVIAFDAGDRRDQTMLPTTIPVRTGAGMSELTFDAAVYYCSKADGVCLVDNVRLVVPIDVTHAGNKLLELQIDVMAAKPQTLGGI